MTRQSMRGLEPPDLCPDVGIPWDVSELEVFELGSREARLP